MNEVIITKSYMWVLLGSDSILFAGWVNGGSPESLSIKFMIENTENIDLNSVVLQTYIFPYLLTNNVITSSTMDRITSYITSRQSNYVSYS
jgi:hypothetical protein